MTESNAALKYVRDNHDALVDTLKALVAIPSISTLSEHKPDLQRAAEFLATEMKATGLENVQIMPTEGQPIVYGDWLNAPGKPTVLIYGHYDVQPADMADGWHNDPFTPTVQDDALYGRGASDMKGQVIAALSALRALHQHNGSLPINFKLLLEGEEEIGSPNLPKFLTDNQALLAADFSLNPDAGMLHATQPAITYALRGLAYFELRVYGPQQDLHSGLFGGAVHNPANVLAKLIAGMHDDNGRIMLPGFYDSVRELDAEERATLAQLPYNDDDIRKSAANPPRLYGEHNYTAIERIGARPSLDVNGLYSGFTGEGSKTVLPAKAMAKISTRLVADQDPIQVEKQLRDYLTANAPDSVTWELTLLGHCPTAITDRNSPWIRAMQRALESGFGVPPVFRREGASVPIVGYMQQLLGIETVLTGFGAPDDGIHGPNEKMRLPNYFKGIESLIHFFINLAQ